jgi:hypothetical protein
MNMETIDFGFGGSIMVGYVDRCIDNILATFSGSNGVLSQMSFKLFWETPTRNYTLKEIVWNKIYNDESTMCIATDAEWLEYLDMVFDGCDDVEPFVVVRNRRLEQLIG